MGWRAANQDAGRQAGRQAGGKEDEGCKGRGWNIQLINGKEGTPTPSPPPPPPPPPRTKKPSLLRTAPWTVAPKGEKDPSFSRVPISLGHGVGRFDVALVENSGAVAVVGAARRKMQDVGRVFQSG